MFLKGNNDKKRARMAVSIVGMHNERRLQQIMRADRNEESEDGDGLSEYNDEFVVHRPENLLFDKVCTLTDMPYVMFHGTVIVEGSETYQFSMSIWAGYIYSNDTFHNFF
jgi:hypothetical protein